MSSTSMTETGLKAAPPLSKMPTGIWRFFAGQILRKDASPEAGTALRLVLPGLLAVHPSWAKAVAVLGAGSEAPPALRVVLPSGPDAQARARVVLSTQAIRTPFHRLLQHRPLSRATRALKAATRSPTTCK